MMHVYALSRKLDDLLGKTSDVRRRLMEALFGTTGLVALDNVVYLFHLTAPSNDCDSRTVCCLPALPSFSSTSTRDVHETLAYETETRPRCLIFATRRDRDRDVFRDLQPSALCQNKIMATFKLKLFTQEISSS